MLKDIGIVLINVFTDVKTDLEQNLLIFSEFRSWIYTRIFNITQIRFYHNNTIK
jgi:hypothetical protein